jgi:hypothetical protein
LATSYLFKPEYNLSSKKLKKLNGCSYVKQKKKNLIDNNIIIRTRVMKLYVKSKSVFKSVVIVVF